VFLVKICDITYASGLKPVIDSPTIVYADNAACIAQVKGRIY